MGKVGKIGKVGKGNNAQKINNAIIRRLIISLLSDGIDIKVK